MLFDRCYKQQESSFSDRIDLCDSADKPIRIRFFQFGVVGTSGFIVDSLVYFAAQSIGLDHLLARWVSFWFAASTTWILNRAFTYQDILHEQASTQLFKYMLMSCFTFVLNWGSYQFLTTFVPFFIDNKYAAFVLGVLIGMFVNFSLSHLLVFKPKKQALCE